MLVLRSSREQFAPTSPSRFDISLYSGPKFRPRYARFIDLEQVAKHVKGRDGVLVSAVQTAAATVTRAKAEGTMMQPAYGNFQALTFWHSLRIASRVPRRRQKNDNSLTRG